jgi:hypothetical protein
VELSHHTGTVPVLFAAGLAEPNSQSVFEAQLLAFVAEQAWLDVWLDKIPSKM